jgi:hypothetical protein
MMIESLYSSGTKTATTMISFLRAHKRVITFSLVALCAFWLTPSWSEAGPFLQGSRGSRANRVSTFILLGLIVMVMVAGVLLARRNLRIGRGDRRGALRLARLAFGLGLATWILGNDHVLDPWEIMLAVMAVSTGLLYAGITWLLYIALEPFVRRRWPRVLVSWNRLLSGSVRDPLVGRDALGGCAMGVAIVAADAVGRRLTSGAPLLSVLWFDLLVRPTRTFLQFISFGMVNAILFGLASLCVLLLLRMLVRKEWLAAAVLGAIFGAARLGDSENRLLSFLFTSVSAGFGGFLTFRFGLVSLVSGQFVFFILSNVPLTIDPSAWYAGPGLAVLLLILAIAVAAFIISIGGRPLFGRMALED